MDGEAQAFAFKRGKQPYMVQSSFPCLTAIGITMRQRSGRQCSTYVLLSAFRVRPLPTPFIKPTNFRKFLILHAYSLDTNIIFYVNPIVRV